MSVYSALFHRLQDLTDYTTLAIETTGLNPGKDLVTFVTMCTVKNKKIQAVTRYPFNWANDGQQHTTWENRKNKLLCEVPALLEHNTRQFDVLAKISAYPFSVCADLYKIWLQLDGKHELIVTHNGWQFDLPFLSSLFEYFEHPTENIFDGNCGYSAGLVEKAAQLPKQDDPDPHSSEDLIDYFERIGSLHASARWSFKYCNDCYNLAQSAGVTADNLFSADAKAVMLHHLFEEQRKRA